MKNDKIVDKHALGNMIYNLQEKASLNEVTFTKQAVAEVLCYLEKLQPRIIGGLIWTNKNL